MRWIVGYILSCLFVNDYALASRFVRIDRMPERNHGIIGGEVIDRQKFPEVVQLIVFGGRGRCTGTLVGPEVVLTAGHCVQREGDVITVELADRRTRLQATCERSPFISQRIDHDIALCKLSRAVDVPRFPNVDGRAKAGGLIKMIGLGCTQRNQTGGNDGLLRIGAAKVIADPNEAQRLFDMRIQSSTAALCPGDSGGPTMALFRNQPRRVLGVNSKVEVNGDVVGDESLVTATFTAASRDFLGDFATQNGVKICGVTDQC